MKTIVVAEAGLCHLGNLEEAKNLCLIAKAAKCSYVKFQKRSPPYYSTPKEDWDKDRNTPFGVMNTLKYREKLEFEAYHYAQISEYCKNIGIKWAASAWDKNAVDFLNRDDVDLIKVPSAKLTDLELIEKVWSCFKDKIIVLSTGMSTHYDIINTVSLINSLDQGYYRHHSLFKKRYLLSCNSTYPIENLSEINLNRIKVLKELTNWHIGFSDHSYLLHTTIVAVALGAEMVERHICSTKHGIIHPDAQASVLPWGLQKMVNGIEEIEQAMGDGKIEVYDSEIPIRNKLRGIDVL